MVVNRLPASGRALSAQKDAASNRGRFTQQVPSCVRDQRPQEPRSGSRALACPLTVGTVGNVGNVGNVGSYQTGHRTNGLPFSCCAAVSRS